jgi:hypothetical protein
VRVINGWERPALVIAQMKLPKTCEILCPLTYPIQNKRVTARHGGNLHFLRAAGDGNGSGQKKLQTQKNYRPPKHREGYPEPALFAVLIAVE